jgi:hypothetical protein
LSERNANRLRNSLGDFISHGRRVGGRAKRGTATQPARADRNQTGAMRSWLQEHGHDVSSRVVYLRIFRAIPQGSLIDDVEAGVQPRTSAAPPST